ncbi:MAG: hypothetical protein WAK19_15715 [Candidatus Cybelea sp.]
MRARIMEYSSNDEQAVIRMDGLANAGQPKKLELKTLGFVLDNDSN